VLDVNRPGQDVIRPCWPGLGLAIQLINGLGMARNSMDKAGPYNSGLTSYNSTVHTPRQYFILSKHIDRDATCDYKKTTELSILDGPHP